MPVGTLPEPYKNGHSFDGWYTRESGGLIVNSSAVSEFAGNTTLYARWIEGTDKREFNYSVSGNTVTIKGLKSGNELTSIVIPSVIDGNTRISIVNFAFKNNTSLTEVTVPVNAETGYGILYNCTSLERVTLPLKSEYSANNNSYLGWYFYSTELASHHTKGYGSYIISRPASLKEVTINGEMTGIPTGAFYGFSKLTKITLPEGATSVGAYAFYNCTNVKELAIPRTVTAITRGALYGMTSLEKLTLPMVEEYSANNHSYIKYLFGANSYSDSNYPVKHLKTVVVYSSTTKVANYAFNGLTGLERVVFEGEITSVGNYAFDGCSNLRIISLGGNTPPSVGTDCISGTHEDLMFIVPDDAIAVYKADDAFTSLTVAGQSAAVIFYICDGTLAETRSEIRESGTVFAEPQTPILHNYVFGGWYTDSAFTNAYDFNAPLRGAAVLYGKWSYVPLMLDAPINVVIDSAGGQMYYTYEAASSEPYKVIVSDASSSVRLTITSESQSLYDSTGTTPSYTINAIAGKTYVVRVSFTSATVTGSLNLSIKNG